MRFTTAVLMAVGVVASTCGIALAGEAEPAGQIQPVTSDKTLAPTMEDPSKSVSERTWYGWQNLLVMTGSIGLGVLVGQADSIAGILVGVSGFYLGPPAVHWAHGNVKTGFVSLGVGVGGGLGLALVGVGIGYPLDPPSGKSCAEPPCGGVVGVYLGILGEHLGGVAYVIVDSAVLAYDEPPASRITNKSDDSSFNLTPQVWVGRDQTTFGLAGQF